MNRKGLLLLAVAALVLFRTPPEPPNSGDEIFLYRAVTKLAPEHFPPNQGRIGSCVAKAHAAAIDTLLAQDALKRRSRFVPVNAESIYGGARNEAQGRVGNSYRDGSSGYAATKWLGEVGGILLAKPYPEYRVDLTTYDVARCKNWGAKSNGGDSTLTGPLDDEARKRPLKGVAKVTTLEELDRALANGCTVTVCSGIGFESPRDKDGFCEPRGKWSHCLSVHGKRNNGRKGYLIINTWDDYIEGDGPNSPNKYLDQPDGSFYVEPAVMLRMLRAGDSWALSLEEFQNRELPPLLTVADVTELKPDPISTPLVYEDYDAAHGQFESGQTLVVFVTASWCHLCPAAKERFLDAAAPYHGRVAVWIGDHTKDAEAREMAGDGGLPFVACYRPDDGRAFYLRGPRSKSEYESLLRQATSKSVQQPKAVPRVTRPRRAA